MSVLLSAQQVSVRIRQGRGWLPILQDCSLRLMAGQTLGLVGESGSGKSTLARALLRLVPLASGVVCWGDQDVAKLTQRACRSLRPSYQAIFQQPSLSLSPRFSVFDAIAEPLRVQRPWDRLTVEQRTLQAMAEVGLALALRDRRPHQLSGGQAQRVAIARALISRPRVLICDEIVSALDLSIQAQVLNRLMARCRELGTAVLFISHDLAVVRRVSDHVCVMHRGRLIEEAPTDQLFTQPQHAYTKQLIEASHYESR